MDIAEPIILTPIQPDTSTTGAIPPDSSSRFTQSQYISANSPTYNSGSGVWMGIDNGVGKISIGSLTYDGTTLTVPSISATSGTIAGFTIAAQTITGTGVVISSASNASIAFGNTPPTSPTTGTGIYIDKTGLFGLSSNTQNFAISGTDGSITANKGTIGGLTLASSSLTGTGFKLSSSGDASIAFGTTPPTGPSSGTGIYIDKSALYGLAGGTQNFIISAADGSIYAQLGTIAGFSFTNNALYTGTTTSDSNVLIDALNYLIRLGPTSGNYLTLDGANLRVRSSNYVSGITGAGFTLEPDLLEVGNIAARGLIRSSVLQYNNVQVHSGSQWIAQGGDVLDADMIASDSSTFTIKGTDTFAVGDRLRIKDGTNDEWLQVTGAGSAPTYTVTRDKAGAYAPNSNPAWKKGVSVINYGQSGAGGIYLTASDTNAPYISVFTHAGSPWSTTTTQLRIGNLNGYLGYVADTFGFGVGDSSGTNANITIDPTNGIRIRKGTTNVMTLDNSGNAAFTGSITAAAGTIGGFSIGSTTLSATNLTLTSGAANTANISVGTGSNLAGMNSGASGTDIAFWAGDTFANRATASWRVTLAGLMTATGVDITGKIALKQTFTAGFATTQGYVAAIESDGDVYPARYTANATAVAATQNFSGSSTAFSDAFSLIVGHRETATSFTCSAFTLMFIASSGFLKYENVVVTNDPIAFSSSSAGNAKTGGTTNNHGRSAQLDSSSALCVYLKDTTAEAFLATNLDTSSVSIGSDTSVSTNAATPIVVYSTTGTFSCAYVDTSTGNIKVVQITVSGSTITVGTPATVVSTIGSKLWDFKLVPGTTQSYVLSFQDTSNNQKTIAFTFNGSTVSAGTAQTVVATTADVELDFDFLSATSFVFVYSNGTTATAYSATLSGTAITLQTSATIATVSSGARLDVVGMGQNTFAFEYDAGSNTRKMGLGRMTGNTPSNLGTDLTVSSSDDSTSGQIVKINPKNIGVFHQLNDGTQTTEFVAIQPTNTFEQKIGVFASAVAASASVGVTMLGYSGDVSGLTTATPYYLDVDGALITRSQGGLKRMGIALSATTFKVE